MQGTAPAAGPESDSLRAFNEAYVAEYGELSPLPFIREAYDAAIAVGLAAAIAGSTDSGAIRDSLRAAAAPPGESVSAGSDGIAAALDAILNGDEINYAGAATSLDWDANGDVTSGYIGVWQYTDGEIEEVSVTAFDLSGGPIVAMPSDTEDDFEQSEPIIADEPLKIGLLADFSGPLAEFGPTIQTGVELAIKQLNDGGGVLGHPVQLVTGDTALDPTQATEETRRLIEVEGVHAIVGPLASSITLAIVEAVAADAGIPVISPSATSPQLTIAEDDDFLFRSTVSDAAQGPVLAQLAADEGYSNVGVIYLNDPYGQGLADAFAAAWGGSANIVSIEPRQATYLAELQQAADNDAEVLIVIAFPQEAEIFMREALEQGLFDEFLFVDGSKSQELVDAIGGEYLEGMKGTAPRAGAGVARPADVQRVLHRRIRRALPAAVRRRGLRRDRRHRHRGASRRIARSSRNPRRPPSRRRSAGRSVRHRRGKASARRSQLSPKAGTSISKASPPRSTGTKTATSPPATSESGPTRTARSSRSASPPSTSPNRRWADHPCSYLPLDRIRAHPLKSAPRGPTCAGPT